MNLKKTPNDAPISHFGLLTYFVIFSFGNLEIQYTTNIHFIYGSHYQYNEIDLKFQ